MNYFFVPLFFLALLSLTQADKHEIDDHGVLRTTTNHIKRTARILDKYTVHVVNEIFDTSGPILKFRCQSRDDDLGEQTPKPGQDFNWSFKLNVLRSTLFFCSFNRGQQKRSFDVFNVHIARKCTQCFLGSEGGRLLFWSC
ncbi:hypothetical protein Acr_01g0012810 [Actinidia rufa]|uniref:S-protein homolog n=1 Tax=Actinidia rufa TaxID=165716 RepID=A0A7J0E5C9_9ERIC|nr:hypothetical protein Acr_01g0012810 [Actinidia rufa]